VHHGWALIGLTAKFLAPATVLAAEFSADSVTFKVREPGTFALYLKKGKPAADGLVFESRGNGLWITKIPASHANHPIKINKS